MNKAGRIIFVISILWFLVGCMVWVTTEASDQFLTLVFAVPSIVGLLIGGAFISKKKK